MNPYRQSARPKLTVQSVVSFYRWDIPIALCSISCILYGAEGVVQILGKSSAAFLDVVFWIQVLGGVAAMGYVTVVNLEFRRNAARSLAHKQARENFSGR